MHKMQKKKKNATSQRKKDILKKYPEKYETDKKNYNQPPQILSENLT